MLKNSEAAREFAVLSYKQKILKTLAYLLFSTGALAVINRIANTFQCNAHGAGRIAFPFVRRRQSSNVQILAYHRVNDEEDPFFPGIPTRVFKNQMEYLISNCCVCSLDEAVARLASRDVPDNAVVITFDDGYRDNYLNAFPILKELSIPATIFLATGAIGSQRVLWHDRVFSAFRETRVMVLDGFATPLQRYRLSTVEEKLFAQKEFLKFMWSLEDEEKTFRIDLLVERLEVLDRQKVPGLMLSWEDVKMMHERGISFGSHTVSHPILSKLSMDRARQEIQESKAMIEEKLLTPIRTFAYPNGRTADFNESTKSLLKEAGYMCALTTKFGTNETDEDLFELRRATPWAPDIHTFALRLSCYKFCY